MDRKPTFTAYLSYILAAAFLCYEMALQVSPSIMTPELMRDLQIDAMGLGVVAGVYFYSYTLMQIPAGLFFDRYHPRLLLSASALLCALGATLFSSANSILLIGTGRFLMGIGSAFAFIGVLVVAVRWFPAKYFALLVGVAQLLAALGAMSGEVPLAALVSRLGWRSTIQYIAIGGFLLAIILFLSIRDNKTSSTAKIQSGKSQRVSVRGSLTEIFRDNQTWWVALYAFCGWVPVSAFAALWGVPYLSAVYSDISSTGAAIAIAMIWIGQGISSPFIGWFSDKIGRRCIILNICAAIGFVSSSFILFLPQLPFSLMFILLFAFGVATAGQILSFAVVKDNNRSTDTATAIGFNNMAVVAGGALFQPLVGILLRTFWDGKMLDQGPLYSANNYRIALSVVPICFLLGWIASGLFIRETYCKSKYSD